MPTSRYRERHFMLFTAMQALHAARTRTLRAMSYAHASRCAMRYAYRKRGTLLGALSLPIAVARFLHERLLPRVPLRRRRVAC